MRHLTSLLLIVPALALVAPGCGGSEGDDALFGAGAGAGAGGAAGGQGGKAAGDAGKAGSSGGAAGGMSGTGGSSAGKTGAGSGGAGGATAGSAGAPAGAGGAGASGKAGAGGAGASGKAGAGGAGAGGKAGTGGAGASGTAGASGKAGAGGAGAGGAGGDPGGGCTDGALGGDETDVDCGGSCKPCQDGRKCQKFSDCEGGICNGGTCESTPTCTDGKQNAAETDVDCGGATCDKCKDGQACKVGADCAGGKCAAGACKTPRVLSLGAPQDVRGNELGEPWFADIADIDADGHADVLVADSQRGQVVFLKNAGGALSIAGSTPSCGNPFHVLARQMNGDAHLDFVVACDGGAAQIQRGDGAGAFTNPTTFNHPNAWANIVDELGGTPGNDLVTLSNANGQNEFLRLTSGPGTFSAPVGLTLPAAPSHGLAVDLTGDGLKDLAIAGVHTDGNGTQVFLQRNNGAAGFVALPALSVAPGPRSLAAGDLDLDGDQDLVVASPNSDTVTVFLGKGDGTFAPGKTYPGGDGARWVAVADLDADGAPDLAVVSVNDDRLRIFLNDGSGGFVARPASTLGGAREPRAITAGDLDGDGLPDLVIPYSGSAGGAGGVLVFLNTSK